jgi:hypothetical protein
MLFAQKPPNRLNDVSSSPESRNRNRRPGLPGLTRMRHSRLANISAQEDYTPAIEIGLLW